MVLNNYQILHFIHHTTCLMPGEGGERERVILIKLLNHFGNVDSEHFEIICERSTGGHSRK